jgi:hypothetical protein
MAGRAPVELVRVGQNEQLVFDNGTDSAAHFPPPLTLHIRRFLPCTFDNTFDTSIRAHRSTKESITLLIRLRLSRCIFDTHLPYTFDKTFDKIHLITQIA